MDEIIKYKTILAIDDMKPSRFWAMIIVIILVLAYLSTNLLKKEKSDTYNITINNYYGANNKEIEEKNSQ